MMSRAPRITSAGQRTAAALRARSRSAWHATRSACEHARPRALQEPQRVAGQPHARHRVAAELLAGAVRPAGDELVGDVIVALRGVEQRVADRHRRRGAERARSSSTRSGCRAAHSSAASEPSEWPTSAARADAGRVEQRGNPVGDRLDRRQRGAAGPAVARQIDGEHVAAVMREIARLQRPDAVVVRRAVDEHDRRQRGVERPRARVGVDVVRPGDARSMRISTFPAACSARLQVLDQVVGVLEADRQPDRAFGDAGLGEILRRHPEMRRATPDGSPATSRRRRWRDARRASAPR